jgi:hypothetical protein
MKWLRSKPADANELDESALWAAQQAAKSVASTPADADMPDQSQETGGEVEDEDMEGADGGVVGEVLGKAAGKGRRRENGDAVISDASATAGGTAVRAGAGGG